MAISNFIFHFPTLFSKYSKCLKKKMPPNVPLGLMEALCFTDQENL